jgi:hypothetical protein
VTTQDEAVAAVNERDLEARVRELEKQVLTLAAAVDAASRMQVATPLRLNQEIRLAGGRLVRRILEKGRLVEDYREAGRTGRVCQGIDADAPE